MASAANSSIVETTVKIPSQWHVVLNFRNVAEAERTADWLAMTLTGWPSGEYGKAWRVVDTPKQPAGGVEDLHTMLPKQLEVYAQWSYDQERKAFENAFAFIGGYNRGQDDAKREAREELRKQRERV